MFNSQIILSGILVYIGAAARNLPMQLWQLIKSRLGVSISVTDETWREIYDSLDKWCIGLNKNVFNNHTIFPI